MKQDVKINPAYDSSLSSFIHSIPEQFAAGGTTIYKSRNEIKVFDVDGMQINVKCFQVPIFINRVAYTFFRQPKAVRSYEYALTLRSMGVETPEPIARILISDTILMHHSYFISVQSPYRRNMYEFGKGGVEGREPVIEAFGRYTAQLHEKGILHKDYSPGNILFDETDAGFSFSLVDINRMRFGDISLEEGCANFARLWGQEDFFRIALTAYAEERKEDPAECLRLALKYREKFWKHYLRKHKMPF